MKKLIRFTESDLHRMVKEAVDGIIGGDYEEQRYEEVKKQLYQLLEKADELINAFGNEFGQDAVEGSDFLYNLQHFLRQTLYGGN